MEFERAEAPGQLPIVIDDQADMDMGMLAMRARGAVLRVTLSVSGYLHEEPRVAQEQSIGDRRAQFAALLAGERHDGGIGGRPPSAGTFDRPVMARNCDGKPR